MDERAVVRGDTRLGGPKDMILTAGEYGESALGFPRRESKKQIQQLPSNRSPPSKNKKQSVAESAPRCGFVDILLWCIRHPVWAV